MLFPLGLEAQEGNKLKFGLYAAPAINWFKTTSDGIEPDGSALKFNYGLATDFALSGNQNYFFATGVQIYTSGGKLSLPGAESYQGNVVKTLDQASMSSLYLDVPLTIKMRSDEIGYSKIAGWFGFQPGLRMNSSKSGTKTYYTANGAIEENYSKADANHMINGMRFSLVVGFDWERQITGNTYFVVGAFFNNGLTNELNGQGYVLDSNGETDLGANYTDGSPKGADLKGNSKSIGLRLGIFF